MLFLGAFLLAMYYHTALFFKGAFQKKVTLALPSFVLMGVGSFAFLSGIGLSLNPSKGVAGNAINWCVWLFLALAVGTIAVTAYRLKKLNQSVDRSSVAWRTGLTLWALIASAYMVFAVADHLWFFYQDKENSGVANLEFIKAKDVPCKGYVLVQVDGDAMRYRCPEDIAFGSILYPDPFVPWPSYTEGRSKDLKDALEAIKADAIKPSETN